MPRLLSIIFEMNFCLVIMLNSPVLAWGSWTGVFEPHNHYSTLDYFKTCSESLDRFTKTHNSSALLDISVVLQGFEELENSLRWEVQKLNEIIRKVEVPASSYYMRSYLSSIKDFIAQSNPDEKGDVSDEDQDDTESFGDQNQNSPEALPDLPLAPPRVYQPCLRQEADVNVTHRGGGWLKEWLKGKIKKRPKDTGEMGAKWVKRFDICDDTESCYVSGMVFLGDGTLAFAVEDHYEIRVFDIYGSSVRRVSLFPLKPTFITHYKDYTVFVRVKTLDNTYAVVEVNLFDGNSKIIINQGNFPWWPACLIEHPAVFGERLMMPCSPFVFEYSRNGTLLRNYTADQTQRPTSFWQSGPGVHKVLMKGPSFTDGRNQENVYARIIDRSINVEVCRLRSSHNVKAGTVTEDGSFYMVDENLGSGRIFKYDQNCTKVGVFAERSRRPFVEVAARDKFVVGCADGFRRHEYNNIVFVFQK